jgi:hypothetical protein
MVTDSNIHDAKKNKRNIHPEALPRGENGGISTDLNQLYCHMEASTIEAIDWYLKHKAFKSRMSKALRLGTIVFLSIGGSFPILAEIARRLGYLALSDQYWGYLALALAATCLGLDKLFGFSSGWMRFMKTQIVLQKVLAEFQLDWAMLLKETSHTTPSSLEHELKMLERLKKFRLRVLAEIEKEMQTWVEEFKSNLFQLEQQAESRLRAKAQFRQADLSDIEDYRRAKEDT